MTLLFLFISAFISSTLFPGGSEAVLAYFSHEPEYALSILVIVATAGNTLGGMSSWGVGRFIAIKYSAERLIKPSHLKAVERIKNYGSPILLLSWLPVIGDPMCVAAGWLRIHWLQSLVYIGVGKLLRYLVVVYFITL